MPNEIDVLLTIFGVALCAGGWVIFHLGTKVLGLAVGLGFGFIFGVLLSLALKIQGDVAAMVDLACALLGGLGGLVLVRAVTTFAFGATGFLFGALIGRLGSELWLQSQGQEFAFTQEVVLTVLASATVMGLLAIWMRKFIMIVVTSFAGATFTTAGVAWLDQHRPTSLLGVFLLAVVWQTLLVNKLLVSRRRDPVQT